MIVRMFAEWCSPNPDNLVLVRLIPDSVRLIPTWFGSVWWFQWFLALIWSGLKIIFNIDIEICFSENDSSELYNAKIVWKRFFVWNSIFCLFLTEIRGFWAKYEQNRSKWSSKPIKFSSYPPASQIFSISSPTHFDQDSKKITPKLDILLFMAEFLSKIIFHFKMILKLWF